MMLPLRAAELLIVARHTNHTSHTAACPNAAVPGLARYFSARLPQSDQTPGPLLVLTHLSSFSLRIKSFAAFFNSFHLPNAHFSAQSFDLQI
jgi:hypothetical protein